MRKIALAAAVLFGGLSLSAQEIAEVKVVIRDGREVATELVKTQMELQPGAQFTREALSNDIKRLYETGFFSHVESSVDKNSDGEYVVTVEVETQPLVRSVIFVGLDHFDADDLEDEITVKSGVPVSEKMLYEDKQAILKLYEDKSYYGTSVELKREKVSDTSYDLTWIVKEADRHKVGKVTFSGVTGVDTDDLVDAIETKKSFWSYIFPTGYYNPNLVSRDRYLAKQVLTKAGYLDAYISSPVTALVDKRLNVDFAVDQGPLYHLDGIEIEGNEAFTTEELLERKPFNDGDVLSSEKVDALIKFIESKYYKLGYLEVNVRNFEDKRPAEGKATLKLQIIEGRASTIRRIMISGNEFTQDHVIRRELAITEGAKANKNQIDASKTRLQNMNYFEEVLVMPVATTVPDQKDLKIELVEKPTGSVMLGAGFSEVDSLIGSLELSQANFDLDGWPMFRGAGQKMRLRLEAGTERSNFELTFTEPWLYNRPLSLSSSFYLRERDWSEYDQKTVGTAWSLSRRLKRFWSQTFSYRLERIKLEDFDESASPELKEEEGSYTVSRVGVYWVRDSRNHIYFPTAGSRFRSGLSLQSELIGAYTNSYNVELSYDLFHAVNSRDWVMHLGVDLNQANAFEGDDLALFDRLYTGGQGSIRGFKFRDVGPVDSNEDPLGGEMLFNATAEMIIPMAEKFKLVFFSDAGNVWEDAWDLDPSDVNVSVGVGLRIVLPMAPISLDYGVPVVTQQKHLEDSSGRFHFSFGFNF